MSDLTPAQVVARAELRIVDIRELEERRSPLGYIPASRLFPESRVREQPELLQRAYPTNAPLVLACMSGRRSAQLVEVVRAVGFQEVNNLVGGLLGWGAEGLPLAGQIELDALASLDIDEAIQALTSCFVVAAVESDLDNDTYDPEFDPKAFVDAIVREEIASGGSAASALQAALDRLAEAARARGHSLERIASNIDHMREVIQRLG